MISITCNFIKRIEQILVELDISAIEDYVIIIICITIHQLRNTIKRLMFTNDRKTILQTLHTDTVNKASTNHERNVVLDDCPPTIHNSEHSLSRKERPILAQLITRYCGLLGSYNSRIKTDASLNVCADHVSIVYVT